MSTLNVAQWFEISVDSHLRDEIHLPAYITAEMITDVKKEDHINETCPLGHKANFVAPDGNNNNIDIKDVNMLDSSDER